MKTTDVLTMEKKRAIEAQFNLINSTQKQIETAPDFQTSQGLQVEKKRQEFDLTRMQRELRQLEKLLADETEQAKIAGYNRRLEDYHARLAALDQLDNKLTTALAALDETFKEHHKSCGDLRSVYAGLSAEAARLDLPEPQAGVWGFINADEHLHDLCQRSGSRGYITSVLMLPFDPLSRGYWVQTGK